jgi:ParB-like chromosome segregation protein Spo0J
MDAGIPLDQVMPNRSKDSLRLADLRSDPHNARQHPERNISGIADLLREVGAARSIVIDETGVVLAGNGVLAAAGRAGIDQVQVVEADGKTLIAVRRSGLTRRQKAQLAIGDNRTNELGAGQVPALTGLAEDVGLDLAEIGFSPEELAQLNSDLTAGAPAAPAQEPTIGESFQVVVECRDEAEQQSVYDRMTGEGFRCRVLTT